MAGINQGSITIENSITNPNSNSKHWIDNNNPLSFFDYLKHTRHVASPIEFNDSYNLYLHDWYKIKGETTSTASAKVRDRYIDLLKDISINFTTAEEKRFLSNIDFDNPQDLAIAVPFYSAKIAEICQFYVRKREQIKYKIEDNKIKGTKIGIEKNIFNTIIEYIFTDDQQETYNTSNAALSTIINSLNIEVEEMFDTYSDYFNIDGDLSSENYEDGGSLRSTYFTANNIAASSAIGDLFVNFDESLKRDIFSKPLVLSGFGNLFSLNIDTSFLELVSNENIQEILNEDLPQADLKLSLKKKLLEKYIGTDIYYLSTNSTGTDFVSGVLFKSQEPSKNLLNSRFATIAAIPSQYNKTAREIGLFFIPDKLGVLHFKTGKNEYRIRNNYLKPDKIYVFPNPEIYGNISNITDTVYEYPLYYIIDNSRQVKTNSFGFAVNDVYNTSYDQLLYAYTSNQERYNSYTRSVSSIDSFNFIVNKGIITDWFQDIFGNQYGLIKNIHSNRKTISYTEPEPEAVQNDPDYIVFDGYLFKDGIEGFNFDYSISTGETFNGSLRTGVTARTIDETEGGSFSTGYSFASGSMFSLTGSPIRTLYFREFDPYIEVSYPNSYARAVIDGEICDAVGFMYGDGLYLEDPVLADSESFTSSINNYYNTLLEGGLDTTGILDAVTSGDASFFVDFPLSAAVAEVNDGGDFLTDIRLQNDYPFINNELTYYNIDNTFSTTILDTATGEYIEPSLESVESLEGVVFVQNVANGSVYPLSSIMSTTFSNLPSAIVDEIYNNVEWIDVVYDTITIQTDNYYVIEKIAYENSEFVSSNKPNIYYTISNQLFNKFSKPFYIEDTESFYFCKMTVLSATSAINSKAVYPEIYEYNLRDHLVKKIYPNSISNSQLNAQYSLSGLGNVNIVKLKQPDLTYNSRNDIISITVVAEDGNELGYILNYKFRKDRDAVLNISSKTYKLNSNGITHNFHDTTLNTFISSAALGSSLSKNISTGILYFN